MTAIGSSPATSPPALPPLITSPPARRSVLSRPMSLASKNRLSQYSTTSSIPSRSRPPSHIFPIYPSSLPYALVRDFAYPQSHPLHYGPPPEPSRPPSGMTTPASEQRRLSDPPTAWDSRLSWETHPWGGGGSSHRPADLPSIFLADGPPWSEDDDLQSPVVSSRHRKHKTSSGGLYGRSRVGREQIMSQEHYDRERGYYVGTSGDGSERYYVNQGEEANGPGGEYVTYPADEARHAPNSGASPTSHANGNGNDAYHIAASQQPRGYTDPASYDSDNSSACSSPGYHNVDQSRYSRDYVFTITSPDEEMHGKAVALFDFERENESELPLVEGQIIWVSYRHGQGWLVAMDPKTQESGLVPEEYVRLLRDIEGGMTSLTGQLDTSPSSPSNQNEVGTPTQADHQLPLSPATTVGSGSTVTASGANGYHQPVVSTFSTSSKDLDPYPQHLLGTQAGQPPPQVVHYHGQRGGSQANTPTLLFHNDLGLMRRGSQPDATSASKQAEAELETLPGGKLENGKRASR
ncbi:hypothetical protein QBC35DRAFT_69601 [Podospora australis]|uniref:SH3 domain-containing protein n=1 Tax=Podospora australis TaxID=1536484 RepID=A0AAN6WY83_9PEZI|nr:hypothetical protein QBC35DRAFT_69601 [Podospora australis]